MVSELLHGGSKLCNFWSWCNIDTLNTNINFHWLPSSHYYATYSDVITRFTTVDKIILKHDPHASWDSSNGKVLNQFLDFDFLIITAAFGFRFYNKNKTVTRPICSRGRRRKQPDWLATDTDDITIQSHSLLLVRARKESRALETLLVVPQWVIFDWTPCFFQVTSCLPKADVTQDDFQRRFAMQMKLHGIWLVKQPVALRIEQTCHSKKRC
jgi:hypothetical protein